MRKCDFCAREVQDEAVYCRYCHRDLPRNERLAGKKRCAFCAEWIDRGTIVCPFCARDLMQSAGVSRPYRAEHLDAGPRAWDPRDVLRGDAVPPFPSEGAPESEKRGVLGRLGIRRREAGTPEPAPLPLQASPPPEEPPTGPRRGLIGRLVTPRKAAAPDDSQDMPLQARGIAWGAEPRPPEGPLSDSAFAIVPETAVKAPRDPIRIPWGRLAGVLVVGGFVAIAFLAWQTGWLAGLGDFLGGLVGPPSSAAAPTPTGSFGQNVPVLPGPSPTSAPTGMPLDVTRTPDPLADCVSWEQVTVADEGRTLCVYGDVAGRYVTAEFPIVVYFSSEPGAFIIVDRLVGHPDVDPGVCVMVVGEIEVMSRVRPVIDAQGEILFCQ